MTREKHLSYLKVDDETFNFYLAFRDVLSQKLGIGGSWIQIFTIDSEEIKRKLHVGKFHQSCGWQEEHFNCLPRVLRKLKKMGLIRRLSEKELFYAKKHLFRKKQFPKRLYKIKWAESNRFLTPEGIPLLCTSKVTFKKFLNEKL